MSTKVLLKAVGDAVKKQQWDDAIEAVNEILKKEPKHYQA